MGDNRSAYRFLALDLLRVKKSNVFLWLLRFHSVFCVFKHLGSLLSLKQLTPARTSDGVLIRF